MSPSPAADRFRRAGGDAAVSPGFCLLAAWFAAVNGPRPLLVVLTAAVLHEAGHLLALYGCGVEITGVRIGVFGAALEADCARLSYGRELLCVLAGPAANLLTALFLTRSGVRIPDFAGANLVLCVYNLLPVRPLDGGRALYLAVSWAAGPAAGEPAARWIGAAAAAVLFCALVWTMRRAGGNLWLLIPAAGMLSAAVREAAGL